MKKIPRPKAGPEVVLYLRNRRFVDRKKHQRRFACRHWRRHYRRFIDREG